MNWQKIKQLIELDTPTVANGLERLGLLDPTVGYTGPAVRALMLELGARVGLAVTARMDTTTAGLDEPTDLWRAWLRQMQAAANADGSGSLPVFAVMESVGPRPHHTVTMRLAGCVGFITNGSIRDIAGVRGVPLACWAAGLSPMHGRLRWLDVGSPVVIDGMTVRPGDIIHADENGALTIPAAVADQVYDQAMAVRQAEAAFFAELRQPGLTLEAYLARQG
jgi:hypothetical protein